MKKKKKQFLSQGGGPPSSEGQRKAEATALKAHRGPLKPIFSVSEAFSAASETAGKRRQRGGKWAVINDAIIVDALVSVTRKRQQHSASPAEFKSARHPIRADGGKRRAVWRF